MDEVTQQNAALVEEAAAAASSLEDQAEQLRTTVSLFKTNESRSGNVLIGPMSSVRRSEKKLGTAPAYAKTRFAHASGAAVDAKWKTF
jgi:hypothetical protein